MISAICNMSSVEPKRTSLFLFGEGADSAGYVGQRRRRGVKGGCDEGDFNPAPAPT
jgi:hypothetical protein